MNNIPVLKIEADNLPEAWEKAVLAVWYNGIDIKTQYDTPEEELSKDATVTIVVNDPFEEPRIHKNFPGGIQELEIYRQEVVNGIHDHWINPEQKKWTYTYHKRLFAYSVGGLIPIDQIQYIIDSLSKTFYCRRSQAVTWMPTADPQTNDPPCLQRIWCRIIENENEILFLNMHTYWRSRDLYKAWYMNSYALTDLQKFIAEQISKNIGKEVKVGRYVDTSDSLHIYGAYMKAVIPEIQKMINKPLTKNMNNGLENIGFNWWKIDKFYLEDRTYRSDNPIIIDIIKETQDKLEKDPDHFKKGDI